MRRIRVQPLGRRAPAVLDERCPHTGKRVFYTRQDAEQTLAEWAQMNSFQGYAYWCREAKGAHWHVTARPEGDSHA